MGGAKQVRNVWAQIDERRAEHEQDVKRVRRALRKWGFGSPRIDEHGRWWCDEMEISARSGTELLERLESLMSLPGMDPKDWPTR